MIYQGSKERISKNLLPFIQTCIEENKIDFYIEPFVGGANLIDKVKCHYRVGFDINHWVITLLKYMRDDPDLTIAPVDCSFDEYKKIRESYNKETKDYSDELKAMIGYFASYGGRFFDGGYGRDKTGKRNIYKERLIYAKKQAPLLKDITLVEGDYRQIKQVIKKDTSCFIYCDPPYKDTKQYGSYFNHTSFYDWLEQISQEHFVLVSEYSMPSNFVRIWHKEQKVMQKSNRNVADIKTEGLYTLENGKYHTWYKEKK